MTHRTGATRAAAGCCGMAGTDSDTAPSFAAVLGYRRSRHDFICMQARLVTVRGGVLEVTDRHGTVEERHDLAGTRVELKRGLVAVTADGRRFFLFGYSSLNKMPEDLMQRLRAARRGRVLGEPGRLRDAPDHGARGA
jgi:hypothetical protein